MTSSISPVNATRGAPRHDYLHLRGASVLRIDSATGVVYLWDVADDGVAQHLTARRSPPRVSEARRPTLSYQR